MAIGGGDVPWPHAGLIAGRRGWQPTGEPGTGNREPRTGEGTRERNAESGKGEDRQGANAARSANEEGRQRRFAAPDCHTQETRTGGFGVLWRHGGWP